MPLPHFSNSNMIANISPSPEKICSHQFGVSFYDNLGREIKNIHCSSLNIKTKENRTSYISVIIGSTVEFIADYKNSSKITYCYFNVFDKSLTSLKEIIYQIELMNMECKFDYSVDTYYQENDCEFMILKEYDITKNNVEVDYAVKTIIRGEKLNTILDD